MNNLKITTSSLASSMDSDVGSLLTPTTTIANFLDNVPDKHPISDPKTLAGQKVGALLAVKRMPTCGSYEESPEVGDLLVVLKFYNHYCDVFNVRNGNKQTVPWEIFFPLTIGEKCCCPGGDCRCEVKDPDRFYVSAPSREAIKAC